MKRVVGCIGLVLMLAGSTAHAEEAVSGSEYLELARNALKALDYEKARQHLLRSRMAGDHERETLRDTYHLSGQVAAAFGKADEAYDHYRRALSLDPRAQLPKGLAPKIVAPFMRAKALMGQWSALEVQVRTSSPRSLTIVVSSDPLRLATTVLVVGGSSGSVRRLRGTLRGTEAVVNLPVGIGTKFRIHAIDSHGNRLHSIRWRFPKRASNATGNRAASSIVATDSRSDRASPARSSRPLYTRWYTWGLAAAATGAATLYFGLQANNAWDELDQVLAKSAEHSFQDAKDLEDRGYQNQRYANIGVGATIGLGAIATYLLIRQLRTKERPRIQAGVGRGSGTVMLTGAF